jgi:protein-S-isoprenylcysteine O-methyltransferase Ste14
MFVVLCGVFLAGLVGRALYEILKLRRRVDHRSRLVFALVFVDMAAMFASWFALGVADPSSLGLPVPARWAGFGRTAAGGLLFLGALAQLRALENTTVLVTTGLFARLRHPIYAGFVLWFVGWPIAQDAAVGLALAVPGVASVIFWRHTEEQNLVAQFGDAYVEYRKRTWF